MKLIDLQWPLFVLIITIYPRNVHGDCSSSSKSNNPDGVEIINPKGTGKKTLEESKTVQTNLAAKSGSQLTTNGQPTPAATPSSKRQTPNQCASDDQTTKHVTGSQLQKKGPESPRSATTSAPVNPPSPSQPRSVQTASAMHVVKQSTLQFGGDSTTQAGKQATDPATPAIASQPSSGRANASSRVAAKGLTSEGDASKEPNERENEPKVETLKVLEETIKQIDAAKNQVKEASRKIESTVMELEAKKNEAKETTDSSSDQSKSFTLDAVGFADDDDNDPNTVVEALEKVQKTLKALAEEVQNAQYETRRKLTESMVIKVKMRTEAALESLKKAIEDKKAEAIEGKATQGTETQKKTEEQDDGKHNNEEDDDEEDEEETETNGQCLNTPKEPKVVTEVNDALKNLKAARDALAKEEAYWGAKKVLANHTEEGQNEAGKAKKKAEEAAKMNENLKELEEALYKNLDDFKKANEKNKDNANPHESWPKQSKKLPDKTSVLKTRETSIATTETTPVSRPPASSGGRQTPTAATIPAGTNNPSPDVSEAHKLTPTTVYSGSSSGGASSQTSNASGVAPRGKVTSTTGGSGAALRTSTDCLIGTTATAIGQTGETRKEETGHQGTPTSQFSGRGGTGSGPSSGPQRETRAGSTPSASLSARQTLPSSSVPTKPSITGQCAGQTTDPQPAHPASPSQPSAGQPARCSLSSSGTATATQANQPTASPTAGISSQPAKQTNGSSQPATATPSATPQSRPANNAQAGRQPTVAPATADQPPNATTASSTNSKIK